MSADARSVALDVLSQVGQADAYANLLLGARLARADLSRRDAAFATELVYGTCRMQGQYDAIISLAADRPVSEIDEAVLWILRLGTHQLMSLNVPDHAAVDTSVRLAQHLGKQRSAFVNAVLRTITREPNWDEVLAEHFRGDGLLAVRYSHPEWIVRAYRDSLRRNGRQTSELTELLDANNLPAPITLVRRASLAQASDAPEATPTTQSRYGLLLPGGDPGMIPAVRDGRLGIQDEGSQLAALALADAPLSGSDSSWLDMCAGPGGKAALLGALAGERGAHLYACEVQSHRVDLLYQSLQAVTRTYPDTVSVFHGDARDLPANLSESADRVLLDAPCTGLGSLRRRPESRWRRQVRDVPELSALQRQLLQSAIECVRPGGLIAYVTCSPHIAETHLVVDRALKGGAVEEVCERRQLWPHVDSTDAMFIALLRRR